MKNTIYMTVEKDHIVIKSDDYDNEYILKHFGNLNDSEIEMIKAYAIYMTDDREYFDSDKEYHAELNAWLGVELFQ